MPGDDYLIPIRLTWNKDPLEAEQVIYPKAQQEKLSFSPNPISVYTGSFEIGTRFKAPPTAMPGMAFMNGKLRYQACKQQGVSAAAHGGCPGDAGYSISHP